MSNIKISELPEVKIKDISLNMPLAFYDITIQNHPIRKTTVENLLKSCTDDMILNEAKERGLIK